MADSSDARGNAEERPAPEAPRPQLLGRQGELARLEWLLRQHRPALVLITGPAGIGKTRLLQEAGAIARREQWHVLGDQRDHLITITDDMTEDKFLDRLGEAWGSSRDSDELITTPPREVSLNRQETIPIPAPPRDATRLSARDPLRLMLSGPRAVVLLIDGYQPREPFSEWFQQTFLGEIKQGESPMLILVADRPENLHGLTGAADEILRLGPIDEAGVRRVFEDSNGRGINPPLTPEEMAAYVTASASDPAILGCLSRLLELTRSAGQASPCPPSCPGEGDHGV
jgi:hypothetical protein